MCMCRLPGTYKALLAFHFSHLQVFALEKMFYFFNV